MCPLIPLFQQKIVQEVKFLSIFPIKHAKNISDIRTNPLHLGHSTSSQRICSGNKRFGHPFLRRLFVRVFGPRFFFKKDKIFLNDDEILVADIGTFEVALLPRHQIESIEADSFWCVSALLDSIQDNYTFAQPGIQRKVNNLEELICRVDRKCFFSTFMP